MPRSAENWAKLRKTEKSFSLFTDVASVPSTQKVFNQHFLSEWIWGVHNRIRPCYHCFESRNQGVVT